MADTDALFISAFIGGLLHLRWSGNLLRRTGMRDLNEALFLIDGIPKRPPPSSIFQPLLLPPISTCVVVVVDQEHPKLEWRMSGGGELISDGVN